MESEPAAWSAEERRRFLGELRPYLLASVLLLAVGAAGGLATAAYAPEFSLARREALGEFARAFLGLSKPYLALAIFLNNALKTLLAVVAGVLAGVLPFVLLLINGYVLGIVFHATVESKGLLSFVLAIAPHGILELPAVLLGASIGLMLGVRALRRLFGKKDTGLVRDLGRGLRFYIVVIVPMLVVAALIEAFVTTSVAVKSRLLDEAPQASRYDLNRHGE
ncbi:MAG TPA: stage II sporulation protein M [Candidatus Binatia bacterium]